MVGNHQISAKKTLLRVHSQQNCWIHFIQAILSPLYPTPEVVDIDLALAAKTTTTVPKAARSLESTRFFSGSLVGGFWVLEDVFYDGMVFLFYNIYM